jgi:hypothetical protein
MSKGIFVASLKEMLECFCISKVSLYREKLKGGLTNGILVVS